MTLRRACVMGHPVAHSRSPMIHGHWLKTLGISGAYELKDLTPEAFPAFIADLADNGYVGGNVTVPHKEAPFGWSTNVDAAAEARRCGEHPMARERQADGRNSEHPWLHRESRRPRARLGRTRCRALVLGAGGAGRSAVYALKQRAPRCMWSIERSRARRTSQRALGSRRTALTAVPRLLRETDVLVNCTSLGLGGKPPLEIDLGPLKRSAVVYDVVYVPLETGLLAAARKRGHRTVDGLGMLLQQAGFGFRKWFGGNPRLTPELRAMLEADIVAKTPK